MKTILPLVILVQAIPFYAQSYDFAPLGATWWYSTSEIADANAPLTFTSIADTIIHEKNCRIIHVDLFPNAIDPEENIILFQEGDSVSRYFAGEDRFLLLYDFSLAAGETYYAHAPDPYVAGVSDSFLVEVTSVDTIEINGHALRRQHIIRDGYYDWFQENIEVIGNTFMLFPFYGLVEYVEGPLRCYEDDQIGHYETGIAPYCDAYILEISGQNILQSVTVTHPDPNTIKICGISIADIVEMQTFDLFGRKINIPFNTELKASITHLAKGNYLIYIQTDTENIALMWECY